MRGYGFKEYLLRMGSAARGCHRPASCVRLLVAIGLSVWSCGGSSPDRQLTAPRAGTVEGVVSSSLGGPVAGVTITVTPEAEPTQPSVSTDTLGHFMVTAVPTVTNEGTVSASHVPGNCAATTVVYTGLAAGASVSVDLTLACTPPYGTISGTVTSSLGGPLAGASVLVTPSGGTPLPAVLTTSSGVFVLDSVPATSGHGTILVSRVPPHCQPANASYTGMANGDTVTAAIVVPCTAVGSVVGTVISSQGPPLGGATVVLTPTNGAPLPAVATAGDGTFQVPNVPVGSGTGTVAISGVPASCSNTTATYSGMANGDTVNTKVVVPCAKVFTKISGCQSIRAPGSYYLDGNITEMASGGACITIDTSYVEIDCHSHTIAVPGSAITASGITSVVIHGCNIVQAFGGVPAVRIDSTGQFMMTNSSVQAVDGFFALFSHGVTIDSCAFLTSGPSSAIQFDWVDTAVVTNSRVTSTSGGVGYSGSFFASVFNNVIVTSGGAAGVLMGEGGSNTVRRNHLDGTWNGSFTNIGKQGTDDGILLLNERGDVLDSNTIVNVYDAGIETVGGVTNSAFTNNQIWNAAYAGIGAYWGTSWANNLVAGNTVAVSPALLYIVFALHSTADSVASIEFTGNTIRGNAFSAPIPVPDFELAVRQVASIVIDFSKLNTTTLPLPAPLFAADDTIGVNSLPGGLPQYFLFPPAAFVMDSAASSNRGISGRQNQTSGRGAVLSDGPVDARMRANSRAGIGSARTLRR